MSPVVAAAAVVAVEEYLEIDGTALTTPAWTTLDLSGLWGSADKRGDDRILPGAAGVKSYPRRPTASRRSVPMSIFGAEDLSGAAYPDARTGLWQNVNHLRANIVAAPAAADGTRLAVLHGPGGATRSGRVHVLELRLGDLGPEAMSASLELSIPGGELT